MTLKTSSLHQYLSECIAGTIFGLAAVKLGMDYSDLFDEYNRPKELSTEIADKMEELGIDSAYIAASVQKALLIAFSQTENVSEMIDRHSELLWSILGNPDSGGHKPPKIYRKASVASHLMVLGILSPPDND